MTPSRRAVICASPLIAASPATAPATPRPNVVEQLVELSRAANAALMRGDVAAYRSLISLGDDFTLMSPFGGPPTRGPVPDAAIEAMGRFFRGGDLRQELVAAYAGEDLVVLALIERSHVAVGGLAPQEWALRVTLVYRRDGDRWRLAHRHADPIVAGLSLAQAAELGRGERRP